MSACLSLRRSASLPSALAVAAIATAAREPVFARVRDQPAVQPRSPIRVGLRRIGSRFERFHGRLRALVLEADASWTAR